MLYFNTMWNLLLYLFFIREILTFLLRFYRTIDIKYNLQSNNFILSSIAHGFFNIVTLEMVTDLNNTRKRKRIYTKHKITTSENDHIMLSEKETHNQIGGYSDDDSPYLPPKYTSKNSTLQSPKRHTQTMLMILKHLKIYRIMTHSTKCNSFTGKPRKVFINFNSS